MHALSSTDEHLRAEYLRAQKEYTAYDRTLNALAAFSFVFNSVTEISEETTGIDFCPKLIPVGLDCDCYTPDGHFIQKNSTDFVLELKTSWNDKDVGQVTKYGQSKKYYVGEKAVRFEENRCLLLGYQNLPGEMNLAKLFDAWDSQKFGFPLVVFRYALEQAPDGDRMSFFRCNYESNGRCPESAFGLAMNSVRGFHISVDNYKLHRWRFHKASDAVIPSYAAVLWWTHYAKHYLTEEQKLEMAERGRLSSPLVISPDTMSNVPVPTGVQVPLGSKDVRRALDFLIDCRLVTRKKRSQAYYIELKEDRYIRLPHNGPLPGNGAEADIAAKILARWATQKVRQSQEKSRSTSKPKKHRGGGVRRRRDVGSGWLFDKVART